MSETEDTGHQASFDDTQTTVVNERVEDFIATSQMIPSVDWIMKNVVAKGPGTRVALARLIGVATDATVQQNNVKGQMIDSIKLIGEFELTVFETGEVVIAGAAYLPKKWGTQVKMALDAAGDDKGKRAEMLLTLGVQATGKSIPYSWTVNTHIGRANSMLTGLKQSVLPQLAAASRTRQIEGTAEAVE